MSVRAAAAPIRQGAAAPDGAADGAPKKATFRSLASVLAAGFHNLSLRNGAHTESKRTQDDSWPTSTPEDDGMVPRVSNIKVGDVKFEGLFLMQSITFNVLRSGSDGIPFRGYPVDGPHTPIDLDTTVLIRSGKLTGFFYPQTGDSHIVVDFSETTPFSTRISTTGGSGDRARDVPSEVSKKAMRAVAVWIRSDGQEQKFGEELVAWDEQEFFVMTGTDLADRHFMDMVYGVYRALLEDNDLKVEKSKLMQDARLNWPGLRWRPSVGVATTNEANEADEADGTDSEDEADESDSEAEADIRPSKQRKPNAM